jgi:hypothetical protein
VRGGLRTEIQIAGEIISGGHRDRYSCTVQTSRGDVPVRVGPGFERRIGYLTPNAPVEVVGTHTDPQGNPWWKIHPPGFNPGERTAIGC